MAGGKGGLKQNNRAAANRGSGSKSDAQSAYLSLDECRKCSKQYGTMTDSQLEHLRDQTFGFADIITAEATAYLRENRLLAIGGSLIGNASPVMSASPMQ